MWTKVLKICLLKGNRKNEFNYMYDLKKEQQSKICYNNNRRIEVGNQSSEKGYHISPVTPNYKHSWNILNQ